MLIGYARVSTEDQHLDLQRDALTQAGCERTFEDQRSGAKADRPGLLAALDYARRGASVVVWRLDRLGRSLSNLTRVLLADLRLRAGERFTYTYNHFAGWEHELRVEAVDPGQPRCRYPRCVGGQHPCPPEWCSGPEALDEIRGDLLGLSYAEDLDLMVAFGRAVLDARDGTVRDAVGAVGEDELRLALARQRRREVLLAGFDRHRANRVLAQLGTPTAEASHDDPVYPDLGR